MQEIIHICLQYADQSGLKQHIPVHLLLYPKIRVLSNPFLEKIKNW